MAPVAAAAAAAAAAAGEESAADGAGGPLCTARVEMSSSAPTRRLTRRDFQELIIVRHTASAPKGSDGWRFRDRRLATDVVPVSTGHHPKRRAAAGPVVAMGMLGKQRFFLTVLTVPPSSFGEGVCTRAHEASTRPARTERKTNAKRACVYRGPRRAAKTAQGSSSYRATLHVLVSSRAGPLSYRAKIVPVPSGGWRVKLD